MRNEGTASRLFVARVSPPASLRSRVLEIDRSNRGWGHPRYSLEKLVALPFNSQDELAVAISGANSQPDQLRTISHPPKRFPLPGRSHAGPSVGQYSMNYLHKLKLTSETATDILLGRPV